jgi:ligand-binding sensor domain-containing protein/serine phosphatase RsbU (regulator of sigma subunit)
MIEMIKRIITLIIILVSCQSFLIAQEENGSLVTFTEKDGIPSNFISSILQDHLGFIWIGTDNGLLKYDGYQFHRDDLTQFMDSSAYSPSITSLFEDSELNLWIGTIGGVIKYNRIREQSHFYNLFPEYNFSPGVMLTVWTIEEDNNGTIWLGLIDYYGSNIINALAYIEKGVEKIKKFYGGNDSVTVKSVYDIEIDKKNNLWISGEGGLSKINLESMTIEMIEFENNPIRSFNAAILMDSNGLLWGCEEEVGFGSFNPSTGRVKAYSFISSDNNTLSNNNVNSIIQDKDETLWLGTDNGINHFDPDSEKFNRYFYNEGFDENYKDIGRIQSILKDKSGSLWLGSAEKFVHKFDPSNKLFRSYKHDPDELSSISPAWIFGIAEDSKGNVWIGGLNDNFASGLSKFSTTTNTFTRIQGKNNINPGMSTIYKDSKGTIWIASFSGLLTFNPANSSFNKYTVSFPGTDKIDGINSILEDHQLNFWIGAKNGLFLLDRSNRIVEQIDLIEKGDTIPLSNHVQHLFESSKKELWIGTANGLFNYNNNKKIFKRYQHIPNDPKSLSSSNIGYIYEDREGIFWLGTWLGGLNRFDPESETFTHYTKKDGLPSNSVQGILEDEDNKALWLSTFEGISRFDLVTKEFRNFDASHGVQGKQFTRTSALETSKGEFLFGGRNGLNIFRPEDFVANLSPPDILISDFKLFNKSVLVGDNSPLQKPIYQTEEILLASNENDISIDFFATHYVDPSHNEYAYLLENYENEWRYVGNSHSAIYPNLPHGEYVFRVKAANNLGVWNNEGKSLSIIVLPPWWKTIWAYIGYGIILILGIFGVDRFQRRRLLVKERNASAIKEVQLRAKIAEAENERKTKELEEARQLQLSMLPKEIPKLPNLDIAVYMKTATEVGGDYYDFHVGMDGTLTVVVGDATGHGMKAGTMVTATKSLFNSYASQPDILLTFSEMTRCIKQMHFEQLSMCMTMMKIIDSKLIFSSAGMPPVYIFRREKEVVEESLMKGMPLGSMKNFPYKTKELKLLQGDTILLLSDGLPELQNEQNEIYGYNRVYDSFDKVAAKKPEEIISFLKDESSQWVNGKEPDDDVTFVVIKVK